MKYLALIVVLVSSNAFSEDLSKYPSVEKVFEKFFTSIKNKDKQTFLSLFYQESTSWVGIYSEESIKILRKRYGNDVHKPKAVSSSPGSFIENIISSPFDIREDYQNVEVVSDGDVATISFEYSYFLGNFKSNWGLESWQLIKSDEGWKINAVNFSMTYSTKPWPKPPKSSNG